MSQWSIETLNLTDIFTDKVTRDDGLGSCGDLKFSFQEDLSTFNFVTTSEDMTIVTIESQDPDNEVGEHNFNVVVMLPYYPDITPLTAVMKVEVLTPTMVVEEARE